MNIASHLIRFTEKGNVVDKRDAIKKLIHMVLSGERVGASLLMHVIRLVFILNTYSSKFLVSYTLSL